MCSVVQWCAACCSVVQCGAACCSVVRSGAVWCSMVQCGAACCSVVQYGAEWCSVLRSTMHTRQHTAPYCTTLHHAATHCNALQCTATHCNTLQHTAKVQNLSQTCQKRLVYTLRLILLDDIYARRDLYSNPPPLSPYTRAHARTHRLSAKKWKKSCRIYDQNVKKEMYTMYDKYYLTIYISEETYGVATISRLLEIIGLFCKRAL